MLYITTRYTTTTSSCPLFTKKWAEGGKEKRKKEVRRIVGKRWRRTVGKSCFYTFDMTFSIGFLLLYLLCLVVNSIGKCLVIGFSIQSAPDIQFSTFSESRAFGERVEYQYEFDPKRDIHPRVHVKFG